MYDAEILYSLKFLSISNDFFSVFAANERIRRASGNRETFLVRFNIGSSCDVKEIIVISRQSSFVKRARARVCYDDG